MENTGAQPGQTITPTSAGAPNTPSPPSTPQPSQPLPSPQQPSLPPVASVPPQPEIAAVPTGLKQIDEPETPGAGTNNDEISWTASEFVANEKSSSWYTMLALAAFAAAVLAYLFTRDLVSVGVIIFGAIMFGTYGARQPRQLEYRLDATSISIGQKQYSYNEFRSFAIAPEGAFSSIIFMPLRRFAVPTTIYFAPEDEENIIALLSDRLPLEEHAPDPVDRLMRRIRF